MCGWLATTSCLALAALMGAPSGVQAQTAAQAPRMLDEITVTARKKVENVQSAPLAVSAFNQEQLTAAGIEAFNEVLDFVPNASMSGGIGGTLQGLVGIRGISTLVRIIGVETGIGMYVDGVFLGRPENFNQELIDIERVEILRGPQGALFGKNTIAGAINIITLKPGDEVRGQAEFEYGNFDLKRVRGYVSGPIVPGLLSGKISAGYVNRDGYVKNVSGGQDLETLDMASFRAQLRYTPTENLDILLSGDGLFDRGEPVFFEVSDVLFVASPTETTPFTVDQNQPNFLDRDIWGLSLTVNWEVAGGTLTSITSYRESSFDAGLDDDKTQFTFFVDFFSDDVELFTQEIRYAGSWGERLDYLIGGYYFNQSADSFRPFALGDFLTGVPGLELPITQTSSVDSESYAFFFNGDFAVTDRLLLSFGGRFTKEDKDAVYTQEDLFVGLVPNITFVGSTDDSAFSPTVSLSYDVSDDAMAYFRFSRGFKSAGFNTDFAASVSGLTVKPEFASTYEVGLKSQWFADRLRANLAGFYTKYDDLQVSQITGSGVILQNAAQADIWGFEAEFLAVPNDYLDLNASVGYLDAEYDEFPACPVPGGALPGTTKADCGGNQIVLAPDWTASAGAQFTYPIGRFGDFVARADWQYQSKVFFEPQNTDRLSGDARNIVNVRAGLSTPHWDLFGWAKNITDERYVTFADDRSAIAVPLTRSFGQPRTYGVTLRLKI